MGFVQSPVAGTAHVQGKHTLRDRAFDPGPFALAFAKFLGVLLTFAPLNGLK